MHFRDGALGYSFSDEIPKGGVMPDELRVNPADLRSQSEQALAAVRHAAGEFAAHEAGLGEAATGWLGASRSALAEAATRWEESHDRHQARLTELGHRMAEAAQRYDTTDSDSAEAVEAIKRLSRDMDI